MDRARSLGQHMLLVALLVGAWIPAAMLATPGARTAAAAPDVPAAEVVPASEEPQEISEDAALRKT